MNPVTIVTVKEKIPIFKGEEKALAIELILCEEHGFEVISQKDLYEIGDKAVYIQPDYCLSEIPLFESFLQPGGDPRKSRLGSNNRIRAIKFNFHRGDGQPIFSQGVILPVSEVNKYLLEYKPKGEGLTERLGITKWEQPDESTLKAGNSSAFPPGMYKTDEENINNIWKYLRFPVTLVGTEKVDGSSITIWQNGSKNGICSRNQGKPLTYNKIVGHRNKTFLETLMFWNKPNLNIYEKVESDSDFVKYGKPYLDELIKNGSSNWVLRGELNGGGLKGSGNKNNPAAKEKPNIKFFGIDKIDEQGIAHKQSFETFSQIIYYMNHFPYGPRFETTKLVFHREFSDKEDLLKECNDYFKDHLVEGIVVRTLDSKFSAKILSPEYDAKK